MVPDHCHLSLLEDWVEEKEKETGSSLPVSGDMLNTKIVVPASDSTNVTEPIENENDGEKDDSTKDSDWTNLFSDSDGPKSSKQGGRNSRKSNRGTGGARGGSKKL